MATPDSRNQNAFTSAQARDYSVISIYGHADARSSSNEMELTVKFSDKFVGVYKIQIIGGRVESHFSALWDKTSSKYITQHLMNQRHISKALTRFLNFWQEQENKIKQSKGENASFFHEIPEFSLNVTCPQVEDDIRQHLEKEVPLVPKHWFERIKLPAQVSPLTLLLEVDRTVLSHRKIEGRISSYSPITRFGKKGRTTTVKYFVDESAFYQLAAMIKNGHHLLIVTQKDYPFSDIKILFQQFGIELRSESYINKRQMKPLSSIEYINAQSLTTNSLFLFPHEHWKDSGAATGVLCSYSYLHKDFRCYQMLSLETVVKHLSNN